MPPVGFEPTISAGGRPKTYALDRAATGTDSWVTVQIVIYVALLNASFMYRFVFSASGTG